MLVMQLAENARIITYHNEYAIECLDPQGVWRVYKRYPSYPAARDAWKLLNHKHAHKQKGRE